MKNPNIFFVIGCLMVVVAICFVAFVLNHPEMSFPWPNSITYAIYVFFLIVTVFLFIKSRK